MKKISKRTISAVLACLLVLTLLPAGALAAGWESDWSAEYIQTALDYGWIQAESEDSIKPDEAITRAEYAEILWRVLGCPDAESECPFTDVGEGEVQTAITALFEKDVVSGVSATEFDPDSSLKRQEGIAMLARAFELKAADQSKASAFTDWSDVEEYAQEGIASMVENGYVQGVGGSRLAPNDSITLGEMAKLTVVACGDLAAETISADDAIEAVTTLGYVAMDGSKTYAIVVEYNIDLTGADLGVNAFAVEDYGTSLSDNDLDTGSDPGKPLKAYVNSEPAASEDGGDGTGNYVIIEVNTEFSVGRFPRSYKVTMFADVAQSVAVRTDKYLITPSTESVGNYYEFEYIGIDPMSGGFRDPEYYNYANDGTYTIEGIEGYQLHSIPELNGDTGYEPFHATNCFDEGNGQYWDFDLPYALFIPEDYEEQVAAGKKFALVLHIHDAGSMDTDPMLTLTEAQGPNNYASEYFQNLAKEQGLGGAIVVCPAISETFPMDEDNPSYNLRISRDNWTLSCGAPAVWQLMDSITEEYEIDMNRIYGSGQSMGGMTVMAMAAQRDNYFAALIPMSCKWGTNFNKDIPFAGTTYYNAPADGTIIWAEDADGNPVDYNNWYYMVSDDNMLLIYTEEYPEYMQLFEELCGVEIERTTMMLDENTTVEGRNEIVNELLNRESDNGMGIRQVYLTGNVGHMSAWFYGHSTPAVYAWLISQTRETELEREKLDLNKPYELADEQLETEAKIYSQDRNDPTIVTYYPTGKAGAGTLGYNSPLSALGVKDTQDPGVSPDTSIKSVSVSGKNVFIEFDQKIDANAELFPLLVDSFYVADKDGNRVDVTAINTNSRAASTTKNVDGKYIVLTLDKSVSGGCTVTQLRAVAAADGETIYSASTQSVASK